MTRLKQYEIIDHKIINSPYHVEYRSQECVRNPDGSLALNKHGQPRMRNITESHMRNNYKMFFTVDAGDSVIEFASVAELVCAGGKKQFNRNVREYTASVLEAQNLSSNEAQ